GQHVAAPAPAQGGLLARRPAHGPARATGRRGTVQRQQGARRAGGPELVAAEGLRVISATPPTGGPGPGSPPGAATGPVPRTSGAVAPSIAFVTLGCPKNTVDSEHMLGALVRDGFRTV